MVCIHRECEVIVIVNKKKGVFVLHSYCTMGVGLLSGKSKTAPPQNWGNLKPLRDPSIAML